MAADAGAPLSPMEGALHAVGVAFDGAADRPPSDAPSAPGGAGLAGAPPGGRPAPRRTTGRSAAQRWRSAAGATGRIGRAALEVASLADLRLLVVDEVIGLLGGTAGVARYEPDRTTVVASQGTEVVATMLRGAPADLGGPIGEVVRAGGAASGPPGDDDAAWLGPAGRPALVLAAPLMVGAAPWGALLAVPPAGEDEAQLLEVLEHVAVATGSAVEVLGLRAGDPGPPVDRSTGLPDRRALLERLASATSGGDGRATSLAVLELDDLPEAQPEQDLTFASAARLAATLVRRGEELSRLDRRRLALVVSGDRTAAAQACIRLRDALRPLAGLSFGVASTDGGALRGHNTGLLIADACLDLDTSQRRHGQRPR